MARFKGYTELTNARNSNAEFIQVACKDMEPITEGKKKSVYGFYDKYSNPTVKKRIKKLQENSAKWQVRKEMVQKYKQELDCEEM